MQTDDILDTVFNEEHYKFWLIAIERTAKTIVKRTGQKPSLKEINDYFKERAKWNDVTGIRFQDLPTNPERLLVAPIRSGTKNKHFAYRKRIQLAIFKLDIIFNFARLKNGECSTP
ncbi:hypothetical protein GC167_05300 [bacterium]|nr:hypothetical protein [bacterium]